MEPSIVVAALALVGTASGLVVTWRKDRDTTEAMHAATSAQADVGLVNAAIAGLQAAFETQQQIATDCLGRCERLEGENADLRRRLGEAATQLTEALGRIARLESER